MLQSDMKTRSFLPKIRNTFREKGARKLYSEEIDTFLHIIEEPQDVDMAVDLLASFIASARDENVVANLILTFISVCLHLGNVEAARTLWLDERFAQSPHKLDRRIRRRYLTLLYRNEYYQVVINEVMSEVRQLLAHEAMSVDDITLAMASVARLRGPDCQQIAKELFAVAKRGNIKGGRFIHLYAWMSYAEGNHALAHDLMTGRFSRLGPFSTNLRLAILADLNRTQDAFNLLRASMGACRGRHQVKLYRESMKKLADAVESQRHDNATKKEFAQLCCQMDNVAIMTNATLEEEVFRPIDRTPKYEAQVRGPSTKHSGIYFRSSETPKRPANATKGLDYIDE